MSMLGGNVRSPKNVGETVAKYDEYEAAQKAVGRLIEAEVPAREISIVWAGLRAVEMITGRLGYGRAAWSGALNGAILGLLFGAIYTLLSPEATLQLLVGFMLVGMALGMVMQLLSYRIVRKRRDYMSATSPVADHYEIAVQQEHAATARRVLGQPSQERQSPQPTGPLPPPQYGIRIDPATNAPVPNPENPPAAEQGAPQANKPTVAPQAGVPSEPADAAIPPLTPEDANSQPASQEPVVPPRPADPVPAPRSAEQERPDEQGSPEEQERADQGQGSNDPHPPADAAGPTGQRPPAP
ncbi:general stress protein [Microbacterium halotolerans]|uniref:general stress protein n=1 Tax=Microbacterium halotolerans TaxID=246613 RepID=UPI0019690B59|nr:general stress protein [Microbacterium halotolerans]